MSYTQVPDALLVNPGGGGGSAIPIHFSTSIPMDTVDPGKTMTLDGINNFVNTAIVLTAVGALEGAAMKCIYVLLSGGSVDLSAFDNPLGFSPSGNRFSLSFFVEGGDLLVFGTNLSDYAAPAGPVFTAQSAPNQTSGSAYSYSFVATTSTNHFPFFTAQTAPSGVIATSYSYQFVAIDPPAYSLGTGSLPPGLSLNAATGALSGTCSTPGTYTFTIVATDAYGSTSSTTQTVVIGTAPTFSAQSAPGGATGVSYSYPFVAT